jgi:hypothetical protein
MKTSVGLIGTQPLEWWLQNLQSAKISWYQKKLSLVLIPHIQPIGWSGTGKKLAFAKRSA